MWIYFAGAGVFLFFVLFMNRKANQYQSYQLIDEASDWLIENEIDPKSVVFSVYSNSTLVSQADSFVLVGMGRKIDEDKASFAVEISKNIGMIDSILINHDGLISHHKSFARAAKINNTSLMHEIRMAVVHADDN